MKCPSACWVTATGSRACVPNLPLVQEPLKAVGHWSSIALCCPPAPLPQATRESTPFQPSSGHPWRDHPNPARLQAVTAGVYLPKRKGPAPAHRVGALGWVGSGELWVGSWSLSQSLSPSPCHRQPGDMYVQVWVPAVPPPCFSRSFVFQIYWPPLPGQTEECFRKGKDPGVSLSPYMLCPDPGVSPCAPVPAGSPRAGAVLCHPARGGPVGLVGQLMLGQSRGPSQCVRETEAGSCQPSLAT